MQLSFFITREMERELFSYIVGECRCYMLYADSNVPDLSFRPEDEAGRVTGRTILISLRSINADIRCEELPEDLGEDRCFIAPYNGPFVEYHRRPCAFCGIYMPRRFYLDPRAVPAENLGDLRALFTALKGWVRENAAKSVRSRCYVG